MAMRYGMIARTDINMNKWNLTNDNDEDDDNDSDTNKNAIE